MQTKIFSPQELKSHLKNNSCFYNYYPTAAGDLIIYFTEQGIYQASFVHQLQHEIYNQEIQPSTLLLSGTEFQLKIWQAITKIPSGITMSYQDLAHVTGNAKAYRAVARALASNKIAYFIPCHRIIHKNNNISGYRWGIEIKSKLLKAEKCN